MMSQRFGGLDEWLMSRDLRAIQEKIETEPKIRKWFSVSRDGNYLSQGLIPTRNQFLRKWSRINVESFLAICSCRSLDTQCSLRKGTGRRESSAQTRIRAIQISKRGPQ
jgi:hypothetical protein